MRLKSIRLAGFKSFVDPTTVSFSSNLSAVVGPNGCGKSNIIDAVRWVMGESSARNLRGESMTDVIFNGSTTRKPVSQASIELIFDNADNRLAGEYAAFAEISIRRRVTRDGQNAYFLNGSKCRRRDITDIFLGTGLGPRSYSIIEQGMITRLIEAKPEELRGFIEEAAGISRYKERRRETESRIRRTQENLARLTDLRNELERQLERLQRQAQAAQQYQQYRAEERLLKAQLCALRWRTLDALVVRREALIAEQEVGLQALLAEQRNAEAVIEGLRDGHHERSDRFNQLQGRFYAVGGDIARVEQSIQHGQQRQRQLADDLREAQRQRLETERQRGEDHARLTALGDALGLLEPQLQEALALAEEQAAALERAEVAMRAWQDQWEAFSLRSAELRGAAELEQARIAQLEQALHRLHERERRLQDERERLATDPEAAAIQALLERLGQGEALLEELQDEERTLGAALEGVREALQCLSQTQQAALGETQRRQGRIASLEALQQAALDPGQGAARWLREQGLERHARLAQRLRVEQGWELAVESVLGADLQAVLLERFDGLDLAGFTQGELRLACLSGPEPGAPGTLADKVSGAPGLSAWLGRVRVAENLQEALALRARLNAGESVVSRDGCWLGRHFLRVRRAGEAESGVLARARELERLQRAQDAAEAELARLAEHLEKRRGQQRDQEQHRDRLRRSLQQTTQQQAELKAQLSARQARIEQLLLRRQRIDEELAEASEQHALEHAQLGESRRRLQEALEAMAADTARRAGLLAERDGLRERLEGIRRQARGQQEHAQQLAVRLGSLRAEHDSTRQALERLERQFARALERCEQLSLDLEAAAAPLEALRGQLEELLGQRLAVEEALRQARLAVEEADHQLREAERRRSQAEQQAQALRGQLEQQRLDWQALELRRKALQDQLQEDGHELSGVLAMLPAQADEQGLEESLERLAGRIQRLGPINLAAIEEYRQQAERKRYLDAQDADLGEALDTLQSVIGKIDRETRSRFRETFTRINEGLQGLFPKVFGGGQASLELTGEDLLDSGVAIMARPPGKKNSSIHLLSGGEKALTALALVFAIFQLNPAPFCMLDEVDAPLDDANVGRYAKLVKEMSAKVQFIYITHNKLAMQMADQLMGVTMHEPGCSRLVAVNVEEAVALAEA